MFGKWIDIAIVNMQHTQQYITANGLKEKHDEIKTKCEKNKKK